MALIAVVAAAGFQPARVALQGVVDRLLFGDRADPVTAVSNVGARLSDDPVIALRALRESLGLPYAQLVSHGQVIASSGTRTTVTTSVPLKVGAVALADLVVGLRPGELRLTKADENVLEIVAPVIAQAVHARSLARELQESRSAVIAVVEDERRRLRRDLHDSLGPTLTGVAYAADAARNVIADDPKRADALLSSLRSDTAAAIAEVRRLVEGLRPPALDQLGLVGSLRQRAVRIFAAEGRPLSVSVDAPEPMPEIPAAVEVAAYRIVTEAPTIRVRDYGQDSGMWTPGVGLSSMQERAQQLGGSCEATATVTGGLVTARLPIM
jgi:two-component system, NarL family, sensor kinase